MIWNWFCTLFIAPLTIDINLCNKNEIIQQRAMKKFIINSSQPEETGKNIFLNQEIKKHNFPIIIINKIGNRLNYF